MNYCAEEFGYEHLDWRPRRLKGESLSTCNSLTIVHTPSNSTLQ